ncbi:Hok/Gef family protein [Serratia marcescens]|uniref:Hok/Gef family protein n=1 Tax=Serratia marcescens TaxID=615 RepID=UPI003B5B2CA6
MVICATVISLAWITRSTLCELRIRSGTTEVAAILATNPNGKATRRRGLCLRRPAVDALIHEHPSVQKKRRALARRFSC